MTKYNLKTHKAFWNCSRCKYTLCLKCGQKKSEIKSPKAKTSLGSFPNTTQNKKPMILEIDFL